jgi:hypothetical protein
MVYRKMFRTVADSSPEIRESWLDEVRSAVEKVVR